MKIIYRYPDSAESDGSDGRLPGSYGCIRIEFYPGFKPTEGPLPRGWAVDPTPDQAPHTQAYYVHMDHAIWHGGNLPAPLDDTWPEDPRITHEVWANNPIAGEWTFEFCGDRKSCIRYLDLTTENSCRLWEFSIRPVQR